MKIPENTIYKWEELSIAMYHSPGAQDNTPDLDTSIAILGDQQSSCCGKRIYGDLFCVY